MNEPLVIVERWSSSPTMVTRPGSSADLLVRFAQRGGAQVLLGLLTATREADLAGVRAQVPGAAGQHHPGLAVLLEQRCQHGRGTA